MKNMCNNDYTSSQNKNMMITSCKPGIKNQRCQNNDIMRFLPGHERLLQANNNNKGNFQCLQKISS